MDKYEAQSLVQSQALTVSGKQDRYAHEIIPIIEHDTTSQLYQTLALRFLEWVKRNPTGVVSIAPTQQFAPFFSAVAKYQEEWTLKQVPSFPAPTGKPDFLLAPRLREGDNTFLGLPEPFDTVRGERSKAKSNPYERADLSKLTFIQPFEVLDSERSYTSLIKRFMIDKWKLNEHQYHLIEPSTTHENYQSLITKLGGIGLSILPLAIDGNVGFNNLSSELIPTTITSMNYPTAALCAHDLGGIQQTQGKQLFRLGSATFFENPSTQMIIVATGSNKSEALATLAKQNIKNAMIYTTTPTTHLLAERFYDGLATKNAKLDYAITHLMNTALYNEASLEKLSPSIYAQDPILRQYPQPQLVGNAQTHLENAIKRGQEPITNKKFLHTSPHHDDIALGYLPLFDQLMGNTNNSHTIATMTSGANAVTDTMLFSMMDRAQRELIKTDPELIFFFKSCLREWEDERLWQHIGISKENVHHLRLGFYHGPKRSTGFSFEHDILPVYQLLEKTMPDIITVAQDPEDSGPETHTKVLQIIYQAIDLFLKNYPNHKLEIWGYRNVWNTFHPHEANMIIPVTSGQLETLKTNFVTFYQSQVNAQFPYALHQGPFCDISIATMTRNREQIKKLLGPNHPLAVSIERAQGTIFFHKTY
ncbi:MAG: hypothetical protein WCT20_02075 [Candidatus Babeliales bacterium]